MNTNKPVKMRLVICFFSMIYVFGSIFASGIAGAESNILFILDASGSMNDKIGSDLKITVAKKVLGDLLMELPSDSKVGLMAYGHTISREKATACTDISVLSPVGMEAPGKLAQKVDALRAMGMTPIASSLGRAPFAFYKSKSGNNHVVLISDGLETCGGDPCGAAKRLTEANIQAKVHVIGFDVSAAAQKELACIPKMGNGQYFKANNTEELKMAIAEVKKVTEVAEVVEKPKVATTPTAAKPVKPKSETFKEVFRDDFDGEELLDHWEVVNPDPDSFIVENGTLLLLASKKDGMKNSKIPNLLKLVKELPKSDWVATIKLSGEFQTGVDDFWFGVYNDHENYLAGQFWLKRDKYYGHSLGQNFRKMTKGKATTDKGSQHFKLGCNVCGPDRTYKIFLDNHLKQPIYMRLKKEGRSYIFDMRFADEKNDDGTPKWRASQTLTMLRAPKFLSLVGSQYGKTKSESLLHIDWVKIEGKVD